MPDATAYVLGLDLSLTRAAAVLVPVGFQGDFATVQTAIAGHGLRGEVSPTTRDARCLDVAHTVEEFVAGVRVAGAYVEDYAFSNSHGSHQLGELRGVLRRTLIARYGWAPVPVNQATVRKLFFGKVPKKPEGARTDWLKNFLLASVREAGAPFRHHDEADAFLVANYGLTECGGVALTLAPSGLNKSDAGAKSLDPLGSRVTRTRKRIAVRPRRDGLR